MRNHEFDKNRMLNCSVRLSEANLKESVFGSSYKNFEKRGFHFVNFARILLTEIRTVTVVWTCTVHFIVRRAVHNEIYICFFLEHSALDINQETEVST